MFFKIYILVILEKNVKKMKIICYYIVLGLIMSVLGNSFFSGKAVFNRTPAPWMNK